MSRRVTGSRSSRSAITTTLPRITRPRLTPTRRRDCSSRRSSCPAAYDGVDIHILAYAFDALDPRIDVQAAHVSRGPPAPRPGHRREAARARRATVRAERVEQLAAGGAVGRPHVARALVEAGHVQTVSEAFDRYLAAGKPAYVEKARFQIERRRRVDPLGRRSHLYRPSGALSRSCCDRAAAAGRRRRRHRSAASGRQRLERELYTNLARFRGKFITGGSDDHGTVKAKQTLGTIKVPEYVDRPDLLDRVAGGW